MKPKKQEKKSGFKSTDDMTQNGATTKCGCCGRLIDASQVLCSKCG